MKLSQIKRLDQRIRFKAVIKFVLGLFVSSEHQGIIHRIRIAITIFRNEYKYKELSPQRLKELKDKYPYALCQIYSNEHQAYWRSGAKGYTQMERYTGFYTLRQADEIVGGCGKEKQLVFRAFLK